ncbi:MAG: hypothetical protein MZV70_19445 [Desulfobacterales bacterium]|nr:hypothetical protein [Desulfobacterales bacterium]
MATWLKVCSGGTTTPGSVETRSARPVRGRSCGTFASAGRRAIRHEAGMGGRVAREEPARNSVRFRPSRCLTRRRAPRRATQRRFGWPPAGRVANGTSLKAVFAMAEDSEGRRADGTLARSDRGRRRPEWATLGSPT